MFRSAALFFLAAAISLPAQSSLFGTWREPTGSTIEVTHCGGDACLKLASISPNAPTDKDAHNPNAALRMRPLKGLQIGTGFHLHGESSADGGKLYDPKTGKTYSGSIEAKGEKLQLRGYVGLKMFGKSETWTRVVGSSR